MAQQTNRFSSTPKAQQLTVRFYSPMWLSIEKNYHSS